MTGAHGAGPGWSLVQHTRPGSSIPRLGIGVGDAVRCPPAELTDLSLMAVLQEWERWAPVLRDVDVRDLEDVPGAQLVAPITYPRKVLCAGANYYDHAAEMGTARPDPGAEPFFFLKTPTTTVVGPQASVAIPGPGADVDWEAELAVVISRRCRHLGPDDVPDHVAGYLVANDLSARGPFPRPDAVFPPFAFDWLAHKSQDGFCPTGPGLVPSWLIEDPHDLRIRTLVNGTVKQDSSTSQMVVGVAGLVAAASRLTTLEPGDLVLTGTPAGVGMPRRDFLRPGDVVAVEIERLGSITTTMVAASDRTDRQEAS